MNDEVSYLASALIWVEAHPSTAAWVQGVGTLIAATVALAAALFAYRGAREQAEAIRETASETASERRGAIARALWAELLDNHARLTALESGLEFAQWGATHIRDGYIGTEVYDALVPEIGHLSPNASINAVMAFKSLHFLAQRLAAHSASLQSTEFDGITGLMATLSEECANVRKRMSQIAGDTSLPAEEIESTIRIMIDDRERRGLAV